MHWKYPQMMRTNHPGAQTLQLVAHAGIESAYEKNPSNRIAVSVNGVIQAVSGTFSLPGYPNHFEVLLPPGAFTAQVDSVEAWFIEEAADGLTLHAIRDVGSEIYRLVRRDDAWYLLGRDRELPVIADQVTGWCVTRSGDMPHTLLLGGWAADLTARRPAETIVVFVNAELYAAIAPNRDTRATADRLGMPQILRSAFRLPIAIPAGQQAQSMEVRVFALSPAGRVSELNYPRNRDQWAFKQNPVADGPAIKPYR
jgi:hypothetical protein